MFTVFFSFMSLNQFSVCTTKMKKKSKWNLDGIGNQEEKKVGTAKKRKGKKDEEEKESINKNKK